jgi:hypothetical protein
MTDRHNRSKIGMIFDVIMGGVPWVGTLHFSMNLQVSAPPKPLGVETIHMTGADSMQVNAILFLFAPLKLDSTLVTQELRRSTGDVEATLAAVRIVGG